MTGPDASAPRTDQLEYWNGPVGDRWATLQPVLDAAFEPLTAALLATAGAQPGETVVDIGCGTGATLLALARRVGPTGAALGVDISRPMLEVAERRLAAAGASQAKVLLADAGVALPGEPFDLAFSRFGVMFFDDPVAAFTVIRGALAPAGRLVFGCWQPLAENAWFSVPVDALRAHLPEGGTAADPLAPGPFALADPDRVHRILEQAGFGSVAIEPHRGQVRLGSVPAATALVSQVGPASRALGDAPPEQLVRLGEVLSEALSAHAGPDGEVRLGGAIWLVTARTTPA